MNQVHVTCIIDQFFYSCSYLQQQTTIMTEQQFSLSGIR